MTDAASGAGARPPDRRVALVTGAGRRVGRVLAETLGGRGMRVAVHYHGSQAGANDAAREIARRGGEGWPVRADLRRPEAPARLVDQVVEHFGALDVLVNSAAVMVRTPLGEVAPEVWDDILSLNLRAPFFCAQRAAAVMPEHGVIINIADLAGLEVWPGYVPHGISKAGVIQLTKALARALAPRIRVNAIAPGAVLLPDDWGRDAAERLARTTPLARLGSPIDVAQAMLFLLDAEYVTGEVLVVDGGRSVR